MGYRIKECREEANLTQEELAKESSVSRTIISGLKSGAINVSCMTWWNRRKIRNALILRYFQEANLRTI